MIGLRAVPCPPPLWFSGNAWVEGSMKSHRRILVASILALAACGDGNGPFRQVRSAAGAGGPEVSGSDHATSPPVHLMPESAGPTTRRDHPWLVLPAGPATPVADPVVQTSVGPQVGTTPYYQCVAVSKTSDATGAFNVYAFQQPAFNDYPKLSVWPDAYYVTFNMFNGNTFQGGRVCAFDRNAMLSGTAATQVCFQLSSAFGGLLASDVDGTIPPPAGSPNYAVSFGTNKLNVWKFHVDFVT